jgi:transcriptional regulator with XRE-family HTH domain
MDDLQAAIGAVIRRERRERGMTLKELAARAIVSVVYLGEIERGKKYPSPIVLERLAIALDLATPDLLEMIAFTLRGEERVVTHAIGFTAPNASDQVGARSIGRVVNLLGALVA